MGKLPGLIQKALKLSGGHPDGIIRPPVAPAPAAYGAAFQIAALDLPSALTASSNSVVSRLMSPV